MINYIDHGDLVTIFDIIKKNYSYREYIPEYSHEKIGQLKLEDVLKGVQMDAYYPTIQEKAAYLLVQINKGHFFSNGNKRLALVITLYFIFQNNFAVQTFSKSEYKQILIQLFPKYQDYADYDDFYPEEFGFYNLSIIIANSEKYLDSFDELKEAVRRFLNFAIFPFYSYK